MRSLDLKKEKWRGDWKISARGRWTEDSRQHRLDKKRNFDPNRQSF